MKVRNYRAVVIGLGNDFRCDDGVGLYVVRKIREKAIKGVRVVEGVADGTSMMDAWKDCRLAIVVDAVAPASTPGRVYRFDALNEMVPAEIFPAYSTHAFNVAETIDLARVLNHLPRKLIVYGIEGKDFSGGNTVDVAVRKSADKLVAMIIERLKSELTH